MSSVEEVFRFFNDVLSRCDTIHDFTKARATENMVGKMTTKDIYANLDKTPSLNNKNLMQTFRHLSESKENQEDFAKILHNHPTNFKFLKAYENGVDVKQTGFEPSVVQFFEHMLSPKYGILDEFYLASSAVLAKDVLIDYTVGARKSISEIAGKICIMNLGNTAKGVGKKARKASGIFEREDLLRLFQNELHTFFSSEQKSKLRFVVDASILSNDHFHAPDKNMEVAILACSEWDSAEKYSAGSVISKSQFTATQKTDDRVLYSLDSLDVKSFPINTAGDVGYSCALNGKTVPYTNIPRGVGEIVMAMQNVSEPGKLYTKYVEPIAKDRYGTLFDVKRSGDGCQVLEIKQANEDPLSEYKYILVTHDHLAFLKARMNGVPVVFTKKNMRQDTKMLYCINNEQKNLERFNVVLEGALREELSKLRAWVGSDSVTGIAYVENQFNVVLDAFQRLRQKMVLAYFGPDVTDDYFNRLVLRAIVAPKEIILESLTPVQVGDLEYTAMRLKAYIFDFLGSYVDLLARKRMFLDMSRVYQDLAESAEVILENPTGSIKAQHAVLKELLSKFAVVRSKGYGAHLYHWCLDPEISAEGYSKVDIVVEDLQRIEARFDAIDKRSASELIAFLTDHFGTEGFHVLHDALNFKPIKVYEDIWRFLKNGFNTLSLGAAPRSTRSMRADTSGKSAFQRSYDKFMRTAAKKLPSMSSNLEKARTKELIEEAYAYDEFYRLMNFENNAQNFDFRFSTSGLLDIASTGLQERMAGGAVGEPRDEDFDNDTDDDIDDTIEDVEIDTRATDEDEEREFLGDGLPHYLIESWMELQTELYNEIIASFAAWPLTPHYLTVRGYFHIESLLANAVEDPALLESLPTQIETLDAPRPRSRDQDQSQLIPATVYPNSPTTNNVRATAQDENAQRYRRTFLEGNATQNNDAQDENAQRYRRTFLSNDKGPTQSAGGFDKTELAKRMLNDNADVVIQCTILLACFAFINGVLHKQATTSSKTSNKKQLTYVILWNTLFMLICLALRFETKVELFAFAVYIAAVGTAIVKFL